MRKFLHFDEMITPTIIKILFYLGIIGSVLTGIVELIGGAASPYGGGATVLAGILTIILGPIFARVYCEILIVVFKILEHLAAIRKKLEEQQQQS